MPVVRRGDAHRIDIPASQYFLKINIGFAVGGAIFRVAGIEFVDDSGALIAACGVNVADRCHTGP
jgi:hypothetical protein